MYKLKVSEDKSYNVQYGNKATIKAGLITKLVKMENSVENIEDNYEQVFAFIAEMLLVGLQKYHEDEFSYDLDTEEGKQEQIDKIYDILDDFFANEENSDVNLMATLEEELMKNGFLANLFQREKATEEQKKTSQKPKVVKKTN